MIKEVIDEEERENEERPTKNHVDFINQAQELYNFLIEEYEWMKERFAEEARLTKANESEFEVGQHVLYKSSTYGRWIEAIVKETPQSTGRLSLNIKTNADPRNICSCPQLRADEEDISSEDEKAFRADKFTPGNIPEIAPPQWLMKELEEVTPSSSDISDDSSDAGSI